MEQHGPGTTLADISNSVAYTILDDLESRGVLTPAQVRIHKTKYAQLHEIVLETYENEKALLAKAKQMNSDWIDRKKKLDKKVVDRLDLTDKIQDLKTNLLQTSNEVASCEEQGGLFNYELEELERTKADLLEDMELRRHESETLTFPVLDRFRANIEEIQAEIVVHDDATQKEAKFKEDYAERLVQLKADSESLEKEKYQYQIQLNRAKIHPKRIKAQIEMSQKAITGLTAQGQYLCQETEKLNAEFESISNEKKKVGAAQLEAIFNLEKIRKEVWKAERTLNETGKQLENEKIRYHDKLSQKLELETSTNHGKTQIRLELNHVCKLKKSLNELKRRFEKTRRKRDAVNSVIGPLRDTSISQGHQLAMVEAQTKENLDTVEELQADIDILISQFLREEKTDSIGEGKLKEYRDINANLEAGLRHSMKKERELKGLIRDMSSRRDVVSRDTAKAAGDFKSIKEELKVKDLIMLDLSKKVLDVKARLQECSVMYDLIKNQRNKFANLTQACSQEFAEMKEKIKILQNEVEILRAESAAKEKSLADEARVLQTAQTARDTLRLDHSKLRVKYRAKKVESERQLIEIKKLNETIAVAEKEMIRMRSSYVKAVEGRNSTGIQLVDRNDEVCILHEKSNVLLSMLKAGETKLSEIDQGLRRSNLVIEELNRRIRIGKEKIAEEKQDTALRAAIAETTAQIADRRQRIAELSDKLETPSACHRHRIIPGDDLNVNQLSSKIEVLQDILNDKKEQLLEKELVLEEVGSLGDRLKMEAAEGHDATATLASELNQSQDAIKKLRRKMMATVSELSMYQATVLRMENEKLENDIELARQQTLLEQGLAPSEAVEHEWYRMERERLRRRDELLHPERFHPGDFHWRQQEGKLKTMAEPRPNAYVSEELGIPKPYGGNAPFKPSTLGANLRHVQKPRIREIVI